MDSTSPILRSTVTFDSLIAMPVDSIPVGIPLPCPVYIRVAGHFVMFRSQGERLTAERATTLREKGAAALFILRSSWQHFLSALEKLALPEPITPETASIHLRNMIVAYGVEMEQKIREPRKQTFDKLNLLCRDLASAVHTDPAVGAKLIRKRGEASLGFMTHGVNVGIYAAVIGNKMKFPSEELKVLTLAALLHDVGKLMLPPEVVTKREALTAEEREAYVMHTQRGAELLQSMDCPPAVVLSALQHHERFDGKGYPGGLEGDQIHPFARIIAIADVYDSLTSNKPGVTAMSPVAALEAMHKMKGKFDLAFLGTALKI